DEYKDRIGEIVNGTVKRVEYGNVIVDLGRGEAIIRRDELIPRENYKYGDRVRAYVYDVRREQRGPQIFLSPSAASFIVNALQPAEVAKVVLDEDAERIEVVVPDDQLSLAIGRRGQNVRLASQLTGWDIDILTEQEESERRQKEFVERSALFMDALNVDEMVGQVLASEGFTSVEEVAYVDADEIASIDGFDEDTASEIQARAREYLEKIEAEHDEKRKALGVKDELREIPGVTT
ncbi:MAG: transcription termination/antitermination protein NusA, partial [Mesorhizobium sp.]